MLGTEGVVVFSFLLFFIMFWEIKKMNDLKKEKLKAHFYKLLSFLFLVLSNF
jgi:CDP-diglyceride synthetase